MTNNTDLQIKAADCVGLADFRDSWPLDVRATLVKAALTEGGIPPYAERQVTKALRIATAIEKRLSRDIEIGEATLTHAQKQARAKVGA